MSRVIFYDDQHVGLSVERHDATIRFLSAPAHGGKPNYIAVATARRWTDKVVSISGALGEVSMRHQALIVRVLHDAGFKWLFTERGHGVVPMSKMSSHPAFDGWFECDLEKAVARAKRRYRDDDGSANDGAMA